MCVTDKSAMPARDRGAGPDKARRIEVHELMGGNNIAVLIHKDQEYRLRITSNGKLILTK